MDRFAAHRIGESSVMRPGIIAILSTSLLLMPGLAAAQSAPSAQDILNALKPRREAIGPGRGIRPAAEPAGGPVAAAGFTPAGVPAPPVAANAGQADLPADRPSIDLTVQFAFGSADLTPEAVQVLDELGKALTHPDLAESHFRIEGHTDTVGTRPFNQTLSERRASSVVEYLARHFGVPAARLRPVGMGEDGLLVPTPAQTPEARNRRVHVVNLDG
jgi:outer membrane protein OmpA-like peptidoglycan-associated protein